MNKGEVINGYTILQDFVVAGGRSKVSFAEKGGKEYFIKEFLAPKYPIPESPGSEKIKAQKRKACEDFEKHQVELNKKIASKVSTGGNLVFAVDFFRYGTCYYKITEKVDTLSLSPKEISKFDWESTLLIAKCICPSLRVLHGLDIVHGDLKPDNILIKKTSSGFSAKLIDFDDSYFSKNPPKKEDIVGTPEYYSPELGAYITDEDDIIAPSTLTTKSDIFTLGIILCEYFTGSKPIVDTGKTVWNSVANGRIPRFAKKLPDNIEKLINSMLLLEAEKRPTIEEVFDALKGKSFHISEPEPDGLLRGTGLSPIKGAEPEHKTVLRGKGLEIAKK